LFARRREFAARGVRRFLRVHAASNIFIRERLQMRTQFCLKFMVQLTLAKSARQARAKMRSNSISRPFCAAEKPRHERGHALPAPGFCE